MLVAVNDTDDPWYVDVVASRRRFDGTVVAEAPVVVTAAAHSSASATLPHHVARTDDPDGEVVVVGEGPDRAWWWFSNDLALTLPRPRLTATARADGDAVVLTVTPDVVTRELTIYPDRIHRDARIDRQAVDLLPGEPAEFRVTGIDTGEADSLLGSPVCWSVADVLVAGVRADEPA